MFIVVTPASRGRVMYLAKGKGLSVTADRRDAARFPTRELAGARLSELKSQHSAAWMQREA